jgi:hypothetical protein
MIIVFKVCIMKTMILFTLLGILFSNLIVELQFNGITKLSTTYFVVSCIYVTILHYVYKE